MMSNTEWIEDEPIDYSTIVEEPDPPDDIFSISDIYRGED